MILEQGDMWSIYDETDYFFVTTNSYIRQDGAIVMGRGIARTMRDNYPLTPYLFAAQTHHLATYNILIVNRDNTNHGAFQVKHHYADDATLALISSSTKALASFASEFNHKRFDLNFPGIGNGRLAYNDVLPIVQQLPDNIHVWTFKPGDTP